MPTLSLVVLGLCWLGSTLWRTSLAAQHHLRSTYTKQPKPTHAMQSNAPIPTRMLSLPSEPSGAGAGPGPAASATAAGASMRLALMEPVRTAAIPFTLSMSQAIRLKSIDCCQGSVRIDVAVTPVGSLMNTFTITDPGAKDRVTCSGVISRLLR